LRSQNLPGLQAEKPTGTIVNNCYEKALASTENILTKKIPMPLMAFRFCIRKTLAF